MLLLSAQIHVIILLEAISWKEIAEIISGITGQEITYVSPPVDEFKAALNKANVLAEFVDAIAGMQQAVEEGGIC